MEALSALLRIALYGEMRDLIDCSTFLHHRARGILNKFLLWKFCDKTIDVGHGVKFRIPRISSSRV